jgi:hypothetical protein
LIYNHRIIKSGGFLLENTFSQRSEVGGGGNENCLACDNYFPAGNSNANAPTSVSSAAFH